MKQNEKWNSLWYNNNEMKMFRMKERQWQQEKERTMSTLSNRLVAVSLGCERGWNLKTHSDKEYTLIIRGNECEKGLTMNQSAWLRLYSSDVYQCEWESFKLKSLCVCVFLCCCSCFLSFHRSSVCICVLELCRHSVKAELTMATQQSRTTWPKHTTASASDLTARKARAFQENEWIKYI